jgi:hypothetical protein
VGPPPPGATRELGVVAMLLSLIDIRPEGRTVNTHESSLFTGVRGIEILRSSSKKDSAKFAIASAHDYSLVSAWPGVVWRQSAPKTRRFCTMRYTAMWQAVATRYAATA